MKFHHLHFYVNEALSLAEYKQLESHLNEFASKNAPPEDKILAPSKEKMMEYQKAWADVVGQENAKDPNKYTPFKQDMIKQMLVGTGWRITGYYEGAHTKNFYINSHPDPRAGVAIVVTCVKPDYDIAESEAHDHFHPKNCYQYFEMHGHRQGCAVLAFKSDNVDAVYELYKTKHPTLIRAGFPRKYESIKILEAYAYYAAGDKPDLGTVIRFVEEKDTSTANNFPLPGMMPIQSLSHKFDNHLKFDVEFPADGGESLTDAYSDHWVSNVFDRERVLQTFNDVLGFNSKVNFNAGVVGAGEAVIESTVTGNEPGTEVSEEEFLSNQDQIYLPINNSLSPHGHVHHYLEELGQEFHVHHYLQELGQGIQHFACRVRNLTEFIARANRYRNTTGEGLSFLGIPRSYYGTLTIKDLAQAVGGSASDANSPENIKAAEQIFETLLDEDIIDKHGIVNLYITREKVREVLEGEECVCNDEVVETVIKGIYSNMYSMMGETFSEAEYIAIVENKILVDVQGKDVLLQIFSTPVLIKAAGEQAPFFEFIQRVCDKSSATVSPGCGGFGIRNFLTLFLSIEVSNFMDRYEIALKNGDEKGAEKAKRAVGIFSEQLTSSNPVLTEMSDALEKQSYVMNDMKKVQQELLNSNSGKSALTTELEKLEKEMLYWEGEKERINGVLVEMGEHYKNQMTELMAED